MIGTIHERFAQTILSISGSPMEYAVWASAPDEDLFEWHRYKYHRISSFSELYIRYLEKYDIRAADEKYAYYVMIMHDYLDMLNGPLKVFEGINITSHKKIMQVLEDKGYTHTMHSVYDSIIKVSPMLMYDICSTFNELKECSIESYTIAMCQRLKENTIGIFDTEQLKSLLHIPNYADVKYLKAYDQLQQLETKLIDLIYDNRH